MSSLNLALHCVGLMRAETTEEFEKKLKSASGITKLRELANNPEIRSEMIDNIEPEKGRPELLALLEHCSTKRSYFFCIKKCGEEGCRICRKTRLPRDIFRQLHRCPDPVPGEDDHYKQFGDVYGTNTSEEHRPSLKEKYSLGHQIPFAPSAQTARTVQKTLMCIECEKPRVVYSASKLLLSEMTILNKLLDTYAYSCGSNVHELKIVDRSSNKIYRINAVVDNVIVRQNISCRKAIEVPYFSSKVFPAICCHCEGREEIKHEEGAYPCFEPCNVSDSLPNKRKHNIWKENKSKKQNDLTVNSFH